MDAYIYNADIYCEDCGKDIRRRLWPKPADPDDEWSYDSDDYPKGPIPHGGGNADCPQHCGGCGVFLENPLTTHGVDYVIESHRNEPCEVTQMWVDYYGLSDRFLDDDDIIGAIQPIYQLQWANIAEENGESFSGCEITEVCPEGPEPELLAIGKEWVRQLESAHGPLVDAFRKAGITSNLDYRDALYYLFMQSIGHGVGWIDYAWENGLENPFEGSKCYLDDSSVFMLADNDYLESHPEED